MHELCAVGAELRDSAGNQVRRARVRVCRAGNLRHDSGGAIRFGLLPRLLC